LPIRMHNAYLFPDLPMNENLETYNNASASYSIQDFSLYQGLREERDNLAQALVILLAEFSRLGPEVTGSIGYQATVRRARAALDNVRIDRQ
jgi:hypothetical protein